MKNKPAVTEKKISPAVNNKVCFVFRRSSAEYKMSAAENKMEHTVIKRWHNVNKMTRTVKKMA